MLRDIDVYERNTATVLLSWDIACFEDLDISIVGNSIIVFLRRKIVKLKEIDVTMRG